MFNAGGSSARSAHGFRRWGTNDCLLGIEDENHRQRHMRAAAQAGIRRRAIMVAILIGDLSRDVAFV